MITNTPQRLEIKSSDGSTTPTFTILRKINFLIWDRIWPALGYFQAIGVLGMQFWALFGVSDFYLFRQVWSLTNLWPCSNLGFPRSIFIFFAPKDPPWLIEHEYAKKGGGASIRAFDFKTLTSRYDNQIADRKHYPFFCISAFYSSRRLFWCKKKENWPWESQIRARSRVGQRSNLPK